MTDPVPEAHAPRGRIEGLIALSAPFLDVLLGIGERISRVAEPTDHEYYPIQPGTEPAQLPAPEARAGEVQADGTIVSTAEEIGEDE